MARGKFITLEGGDGAGKSTQAALLAEGLREAGIDVVVTREPGGAPGAEEIRALLVEGGVSRWEPVTEALLHFAARRQHLVHTIFPALDAGRWVVCDRFADSTMAYQGYGLELGRDAIAGLHALVVGDFAPDLTVILDLPADAGLERAAANAGREDRYERMDRDFHGRVRDGFLDIARRAPERCAVVDAAQPVDDVQKAIRSLVRKRLGGMAA
ncbi:MAG: dTMP kinase [Rhodospirillales bacterium]